MHDTPVHIGEQVRRLRDVLAFDRLTGEFVGFGPTPAIAAVLAGMLISVVAFGLGWPYWRVADQDLILAYQGALFADGLPQEYFDHTGYLSYLVIGEWYRLLHAVGVLPIHSWSELPSPDNLAAFNTAWQHLVVAGRLLSLIFGAAFVLVFAMLIGRLTGDWRITVLGALALAFSGGIAVHIRILRTELVSAALVSTALLLVLLAARRSVGHWRLPLLALAGLCTALAMLAKLQALFPALAIPVIALAFGEQPQSRMGNGLAARPWLVAGLLGLLALAAAIPTAGILKSGFGEFSNSIVNFGGVNQGFLGIYQALIACWLLALMGIYARLWQISLSDTLSAIAAVALGLSVGLLTLFIRYHPQNAIALANPIEHMATFASMSHFVAHGEPLAGMGSLLVALLNGVLHALARHSFFFAPSARPTLLLEWLAIALLVANWRRSDWLIRSQVGVLILAAWGLDAVFWLRGLKNAYFAYTDPLLILAAALTASRFLNLQSSLKTRQIAAGLFTLYVIWAHVEPVKLSLSHRNPAEDCYWLHYYVPRVDRFPFCKI